MIYTSADQCRLWPRLLTAAAIDSVLRDALQDLMQQGAALTIGPTGGLQLSPGRMPQADYDAVKASKLAPRSPKMTTILTAARTKSHPWLIPVSQAYADLSKRCESGTAALTKAASARNAAEWQRLAPYALARYYQAMMLARAQLDAGQIAWFDHCSKLFAAVVDLETAMRQAGMQVEPGGGGHSWPIQTPDGWLWVIDDPGTQPQAVEGLHTPGQGELVLTQCELAGVLTSIETGLREATA